MGNRSSTSPLEISHMMRGAHTRTACVIRHVCDGEDVVDIEIRATASMHATVIDHVCITDHAFRSVSICIGTQILYAKLDSAVWTFDMAIPLYKLDGACSLRVHTGIEPVHEIVACFDRVEVLLSARARTRALSSAHVLYAEGTAY